MRLSSLGTPATRAAYLDELREHLRSRESELSDEVRGRIDANPLRAFDADHEGTRSVMADAPTLTAASVTPTVDAATEPAPVATVAAVEPALAMNSAVVETDLGDVRP